MSTITTRSGKGSPLTHNEVDANFTNLNTDKYQSGDDVTFGSFTSTGIDDNATSTKLTVSDTGIDVTGTALAHEIEIGDGSAGGTSEILFSDNVSARGKILYDHSSNPETMLLQTTGTTAISIDNAQNVSIPNGNVGIGNTETFQTGQSLSVGAGSSNSGVTIYSGTASQGRIYFGDTTTGAGQRAGQLYYDHSNDSMFIATGGDNPRVTVNSSGNVGIGTTSPAGNFHINSASDTYLYIGTSNATADARIQFRNSAGTDAGGLWYATSGNSMRFRTNSAERMRIDSSGNVGIGTDSPQRVLVLSKSDSTGVQTQYTNSTTGVGASNGFTVGIDGSENAELWNFQNTDMLFSTNGTERMRIDSSGSVGIGTSSPNANAKFEVVSTNAGAVTNVIQLRNGDATAGSGAKLQFLNSTVNYATAGTSEITGVRYSGNYSALTFTTYGPTSLVERMRIDGVGNVIIKPSGKFYLESSSGFSPFLSEASNALTVSTNSTERMRIDASGNVGIGTDSPGYPLDVVGSMRIRHAGSDDFATIRGPGNRSLRIDIDPNSDLDSFVVRDLRDGSERFTVQAGGRVGIGTTSPTALLTLSSSSNTEINIIDGTRTSKIFTQNGGRDLQIQANQDLIINASGGTNVGIGTNSPSRDLQIGTPGSSATADISLQTTTTGTASIYMGDGTGVGEYAGLIRYSNNDNSLRLWTSSAERMRIDSSGNLLVGTTSANALITADNASNTGNTLLSLKDSGGTGTHTQISFNNTNGQVGTINTGGTATSYNTSSDERLKENIVDAPAGNIDDIRVRSFDWKADGSRQTYGMVAQELVDVAPEAVTQGATEDDMWQVDYSKLVPMMIKEIQDLKAEVAALKGA